MRHYACKLCAYRWILVRINRTQVSAQITWTMYEFEEWMQAQTINIRLISK